MSIWNRDLENKKALTRFFNNGGMGTCVLQVLYLHYNYVPKLRFLYINFKIFFINI